MILFVVDLLLTEHIDNLAREYTFGGEDLLLVELRVKYYYGERNGEGENYELFWYIVRFVVGGLRYDLLPMDF